MPFTEGTVRVAEKVRQTIARILGKVTNTLVEGWALSWERIRSTLEAALSSLLDGVNKWPSRSDLNRDSRVRAALRAVKATLEKLTVLTRRHGRATVDSAVEAAGHAHRLLITSQYPPRTSPKVPAASKADLTGIVRRADGRIVSLTRPLASEITRDMVAELVRGTRLSSDPDVTIARIMRRLEQRYGGGLSRALVVVRTEVMDAYRAAAQASQDAAADVLDGWVWLSRADSTTCIACWVMHGTVHPLKEPGPLDHPQGRCLRVPKTKPWSELGFEGRDEPDDDIPSGETLFRRLPHATQAQIAGRRQLALLNSNRVKWTDLATRRTNPGWRPSYQATPLRDLT